MAYSYDHFVNIANKQINKFGGTIYLNIPVDGKVNSGTGQITYNQLSIPAKGIVTDYSIKDVNNINVLENDKQVVITSENDQPLVNNTVTIDDIVYRILEVDEINPGVNQPILYKLHVRNATIAPDLDGFFTTLKGLNIGDVVVDPKAIKDFPRWIKVADNHHAQNITTLVEQRPHYVSEYDDGEPYGGYWASSNIYDYLQTSYLTKLSIELNELLRNVLIETNEHFVETSIALLSKEELDGTPALGSSGRQIDFFNSPVRRVAYGESDKIPVTYWTRDYVGSEKAEAVSEEGALFQAGTNQIYAVRAMIFLQGEQVVKLNDDGETYSFMY